MDDGRLRGLYVVTPDTGADLCGPVASALRGGARMVQYRNKSGDAASRADEARQLRALCSAVGAVFIVNDDVRLAQACRADGVHLGRDDAPIAMAREALGKDAIIGASCYASLDAAREAAEAGADYLAFGSFFTSPTKPDAVRAAPALLRAARAEFAQPLCAIGGITTDNGRGLLDAGADMLAVVSGVFSARDVERAARGYAALWAARNG